MCQYSYYKPNDIKIYCRYTNTICIYPMYCDKINKWKVSNRGEKCMLKDKELIKIPKGANKVRFEKHNQLYVEYQDMVITIENPYDYVPYFVYLIKLKEEFYIKGFEPKIEKINTKIIENKK